MDFMAKILVRRELLVIVYLIVCMLVLVRETAGGKSGLGIIVHNAAPACSRVNIKKKVLLSNSRESMACDRVIMSSPYATH